MVAFIEKSWQSRTLDGLGNWSTFDDDGAPQTREGGKKGRLIVDAGKKNASAPWTVCLLRGRF